MRVAARQRGGRSPELSACGGGECGSLIMFPPLFFIAAVVYNIEIGLVFLIYFDCVCGNCA